MISNPTMTIVYMLCMWPLLCQAQTDGYWLVKESTGSWQYRIANEEPRELTKYDCLRPSGEVRCMEKNVQSCELRYVADRHSGKTERLPVKLLHSGQWVSLKNL